MKFSAAIIFVFAFNLFAQSTEIIEKLKLIETGKADEVAKWYNKINPDEYEDEDIMIIDALLTSDADEAVRKYNDYQKKYPENNLASLALFRIYSYYYSIGQYSKSREYANFLRKRFPNSVYVNSLNDINQKDDKYDAVTVISEKEEPKYERTLKEEEKIQRKSKTYSIQVGAFSNINNAKKLFQNLRAKKYKTILTKKNINGMNLNVVIVGDYYSLDDAEHDLNKINKEFKVNGKILMTEE